LLDKASIIIPTYNESGNLRIIVDRLHGLSDRIAEDVEIVIVDDNSPDGTGKVAESLALKNPRIKVIHRPIKLGVGSAVYDGVKASSSSYVVMMDADLHHRPEFVPSITKMFPEHDIVIASRFVSEGTMKASSLQRSLVTRLGNILARRFLRIGVTDCTHGFRGYKRSAFLECYEPRDKGGEFNLRLLIEAHKRGYRIAEVPYDSEHEGGARIRDWLRYLWLLVLAS
jgi:glycosyltransferase involved in cell wall biosynthesis